MRNINRTCNWGAAYGTAATVAGTTVAAETVGVGGAALAAATGTGGVSAGVGSLIGTAAGTLVLGVAVLAGGAAILGFGCYLVATTSTAGAALGAEIPESSIDDHDNRNSGDDYPQYDFNLMPEAEFAIYDVM